ncbi:MAG: ATP-grasp domain-containing protein [Clostridia bacterium]|nr:ATP-grasp domain-containing protein [Clostridia bacterium]
MNTKQLLPVILGSDQNAYGIARSFYEAYGVKSVILARRALSATSESHIVHYAVLEERLEEDEVFVATLVRFAENSGDKCRLLIPCSDYYARLAARHAEKLKDHYLFALSDEETLVSLAQKENFYAMCKKYALSYPKTYEFDPKHEEPCLPFDFPVVLKPADSASYWNCSFEGKRKVFFLTDKAQFDDVVRRLKDSDYNENVLVQKFIGGDDSAMRVVNAYIGKTGDLRLFCVGQVLLEEHTPEGIGSYAAIMPTRDEELFALLKPMLTEIGYRGFLNIDVKVDPADGTYQFFELNPRQGRSSFFVTAAGANLARVITEDVLGEAPTTPLFPCEDVLWTNLPKGVIRRYVKNEKLRSAALKAMRRGRVCHQLYYKKDKSIKRTKFYLLNQLNQYRKYRRYFIDKLALGK